MKVLSFMGRKVRIGRIGMPLWALALAGAAVVAAAGQAVGPVLTGSVTGSAGLTVEQAVVLAEGGTIGVGSLDASDEGLGVINDEGTSFTVAIELHVGDTVTVTLPVINMSDASANAILELMPPAGVDVEVEPIVVGASELQEAQMSKNAWLLKVGVANNDLLEITISPKDDLKPGFYTLSGRIVQITG